MELQRSLVTIVAMDFAFDSKFRSQVGANLPSPSTTQEMCELGFSMN